MMRALEQQWRAMLDDHRWVPVAVNDYLARRTLEWGDFEHQGAVRYIGGTVWLQGGAVRAVEVLAADIPVYRYILDQLCIHSRFDREEHRSVINGFNGSSLYQGKVDSS